MKSLPTSVIVVFLLCFLVAYFATGVGGSFFVVTSLLSLESSDTKWPLISLGVFILVPPLAFIIGGLILSRIVKVGADGVEGHRSWKSKFVIGSIITLVLNYVLAIYFSSFYLKPLEGVISYFLEHAPDW